MPSPTDSQSNRILARLEQRAGPEVARAQYHSLVLLAGLAALSLLGGLAVYTLHGGTGAQPRELATLTFAALLAASIAFTALAHLRMLRRVVRPQLNETQRIRDALEARPTSRDLDNLRNVCDRRTEQLDAALNDNSRLRQQIESLKHASSRGASLLRSTIMASGEMIMLVGVDQTVVGVSNAMARLMGLRVAEVEGKPLEEVLFLYDSSKERPREYRIHDQLSEVTGRSSMMPTLQEVLLIDHRNAEHQILLSSVLVAEDDGTPVGALFRVEPFDDQTMAEAARMRRMHTGTDLPTREEFNRRLDELLLIARNQKVEHCLLMMSIDSLQEVYDQFGYEAGDEMVWQVSRLVDEHFSGRADNFRLTALHFGILIPFTPAAKGKKLAEELRRGIEGREFVWQSERLSLTVSISLVELSAKAAGRAELLTLASETLTLGKKAGGNTVMLLSRDELDEYSREIDQKLMNWLGPELEKSRLHLMSREILLTSARAEGKPLVQTQLKVELDDGFWIDPLPFLRSARRRGMAQRIDLWVIQQALEAVEDQPQLSEDYDHILISVSDESVCDPDFVTDLARVAQNRQLAAAKLVLLVDEPRAREHAAATEAFAKGAREAGYCWGYENCRETSFGEFIARQEPRFALVHEDLPARANGSAVNTARLQFMSQLAEHYGIKLVAPGVVDDSTLNTIASVGVAYASKRDFEGVGPLVI